MVNEVYMNDVGLKVVSGCGRYKVVFYLGYDLHVPVWVKWLATDEDGILMGFGSKPEAVPGPPDDLGGYWVIQDSEWKMLGKVELIGLTWDESLREV